MTRTLSIATAALAIANGIALVSCAAIGQSVPAHVASLTRPAARTTWGLLPNGKRDKFHWPLASTSLWNAAIGSGARYRPAGVVAASTTFDVDPAIVIMTPAAPAITLYYNGAGWTGGNRCSPGSNVLATKLPVPRTFVVPNSGANNSTAILTADGVHFDQNQPFTRCEAGGAATALVDFGLDGIYGDVIAGAHGGSGLSALGGVIRYGEFASGTIHHAMQIELWAHEYYYCCAPIWPATQVDGYAKHVYRGKRPYLAPGALMALLPSFDGSSLKTVPGKILARAFQNFGAYVVDDTFWNAWALTAEDGPGGNVANEFHALYGYDLNQSPSQTSPFYGDLVTIFQSLQVVTNNTAGTIGGGGTPRVHAPPSIGN
ncbi:MAG: hypothetical protein JO199_09985 [Candidatus Eremiobacteraeota bacterium]|nr:hypothetical protein [Candidatus Eremiobacteraeota bacterium]